MYHYKLAIIGPPAKHYLSGGSLAVLDAPSAALWFFRESGPVLLRNSGGGGLDPSVPTSGSAHMPQQNPQWTKQQDLASNVKPPSPKIKGNIPIFD